MNNQETERDEAVFQDSGETSLLDAGFSWGSEDTFFGVGPDGAEAKPKKENNEPPKNKVDKNESTKTVGTEGDGEDDDDTEEDKTDAVFFGVGADGTALDSDGEETGDDDEGDDGSTSKGDKFYYTLAKEMKEKGILSVDIPEDIDEEGYLGLHDQEIEARVDDTFKGFFEELDEDGTDFLKFKRAGGSTQDFFRIYNSRTSTAGVDISKEADQERYLRNYYASVEELSAEDVEDKIEWHKEKGNMERYATQFFNKAKTQEEAAKANMLKAAQEKQEADRKKRLETISTIESTIDKAERINGLSIPKEDKKALKEFMNKATVKVGDNQYITPLMQKLNEVAKDPEKFILLGQLLRSDFDFSSVEKQGKTKNTKAIKSKLEEARNSRPTSQGRQAKRGIEDYF